MRKVTIIHAYGGNLFLVAIPNPSSFVGEHILRLCRSTRTPALGAHDFEPVSMNDELYKTLKGCGFAVVQH